MNVGEVLLAAAAVSALAASAGGVLSLVHGDRRWEQISRYGALLSLALLTAVLSILAYLFLASDLSTEYVWSHSSVSIDPFYKLVGMWAGGEGGLLLWAWFMSLALAVETLLERRRGLSNRFSSAFRAAAGSMVLLFALIVMAADLFALTGPSELALHPEGLGMSMSLQTLEMALHPPLVFAAYAFCLAIFSASLARFLTLEDDWLKVALPWARLAGLLLVMGIVVGAVWAYYELGWGGYWVWDPVETASLLPMLAVMAFLHAHRSPAARHGYLLPFLGMLSFVYVLLSSFITRTGGLWGSSVHTYGSSVSGSMASRFLTVLEGDKSVMGLFIVIVLLLVLGSVLSYRMSKRVRTRVEDGTMGMVALHMMFSILLLLLLVKNAGLDQGDNFVEFTEKTAYLLAIMLIALLVMESSPRLGRRRAFMLGAGIGLVSILLALVSLVAGSIPLPVALILPPAAATLAASLFRLVRTDRSQVRPWVRRAGPILAHVGLIMVVLSFVVSSYYQSSLPEDREIMGIGDQVSLGDSTVRLLDLTAEPWTSSAGVPGEVRTATFEVTGGGGARTVTVSNHYENGYSGSLLVHGGTQVLNGLFEDLYISYDWMANESALVQVRLLPMVSGVWLGSALLMAGMSMMLIATWFRDDNDKIAVRTNV